MKSFIWYGFIKIVLFQLGNKLTIDSYINSQFISLSRPGPGARNSIYIIAIGISDCEIECTKFDSIKVTQEIVLIDSLFLQMGFSQLQYQHAIQHNGIEKSARGHP